jgi:hypothetical protein
VLRSIVERTPHKIPQHSDQCTTEQKRDEAVADESLLHLFDGIERRIARPCTTAAQPRRQSPRMQTVSVSTLRKISTGRGNLQRMLFQKRWQDSRRCTRENRIGDFEVFERVGAGFI